MDDSTGDRIRVYAVHARGSEDPQYFEESTAGWSAAVRYRALWARGNDDQGGRAFIVGDYVPEITVAEIPLASRECMATLGPKGWRRELSARGVKAPDWAVTAVHVVEYQERGYQERVAFFDARAATDFARGREVTRAYAKAAFVGDADLELAKEQRNQQEQARATGSCLVHESVRAAQPEAWAAYRTRSEDAVRVHLVRYTISGDRKHEPFLDPSYAEGFSKENRGEIDEGFLHPSDPRYGAFREQLALRAGEQTALDVAPSAPEEPKVEAPRAPPSAPQPQAPIEPPSPRGFFKRLFGG